MSSALKRWTGLGLSAALVGGTLAACGNPEPTAGETETAISAPVPPIETSEPAAAEAGEGEGGVVFAQATTDPVIFLSILAITEAHIIAARDAHALGETDAAAEMFAHPVSEVLFESQSVFEQLGVTDFSDLLTETSAAILAGETPEQINVRADAIIAELRAAAEKVPPSDASAAHIAAGVAVDQIERAADMSGSPWRWTPMSRISMAMAFSKRARRCSWKALRRSLKKTRMSLQRSKMRSRNWKMRIQAQFVQTCSRRILPLSPSRHPMPSWRYRTRRNLTDHTLGLA